MPPPPCFAGPHFTRLCLPPFFFFFFYPPSRYPNDPHTELCNAAIEQQKITELRLRKALGGGPAAPDVVADRRAGQILTHLVGRAGVCSVALTDYSTREGRETGACISMTMHAEVLPPCFAHQLLRSSLCPLPHPNCPYSRASHPLCPIHAHHPRARHLLGPPGSCRRRRPPPPGARGSRSVVGRRRGAHQRRRPHP
jgi:hypothetical protein